MRIGIMSFAHLHAEGYAPLLLSMPDVEFIGISDDNSERGRAFAERYGVRYFESDEALLAEHPEGVIVCAENARHRPLIELAAKAGAHVLSEKPLATTLADARASIDACAAAGVNLMTAFPMRFSAPVVQIKRMIDGGGLGMIYAANTTNQGECPKHHRAWFVDKVLAGGGAIMDHTVHLADLLRWYLQDEVVEVYAEVNRILYGDEVEVETGGLLTLTFSSGAFATIDCSWSKPPYYPTWGGLTMDLIGEKGVVTVNAFRQNLTVYSHALKRPQLVYWGSDANAGMLREFIDCIHERRAPAVTGEDGLRALEVALAAYRSVETGAPVRLPLPVSGA